MRSIGDESLDRGPTGNFISSYLMHSFEQIWTTVEKSLGGELLILCFVCESKILECLHETNPPTPSIGFEFQKSKFSRKNLNTPTPSIAQESQIYSRPLFLGGAARKLILAHGSLDEIGLANATERKRPSP
jgi:hypothetical protein